MTHDGSFGRIKLPHKKLSKEIHIMDQLNSITNTSDRERGKHLTFEDR